MLSVLIVPQRIWKRKGRMGYIYTVQTYLFSIKKFENTQSSQREIPTRLIKVKTKRMTHEKMENPTQSLFARPPEVI